MKKLIIVAAMALASVGAFAETSAPVVSTGANNGTGAVSGSTSLASTSSKSGAVIAGNCFGDCVDQSASAKINADAARDIANINAKAAYDVASTTQIIKNTPSVSGPALTTSNDTCMGSTSGSVNIAGLGIGGGSSWVDTNCKMLKNSRELWNMGMKAAAMALMCNDAANKEALELTGYVCPQTTRAKESTSKAETNAQYSGNDPIVRARLGLAPLNTVASN